MSFYTMTQELTGVLPGLSPFLAQKYVNDAWIDICNKKNWGFLRRDGAITCPAQITAGAVSITQGSTSVTLDATASAAMAAQQATANPTVTNLQIRFGSSTPSTGQIYSITGYDATVPAAIVLTLNRPVVEATDADAGYQCYRCYVPPPLVPGLRFLAWDAVVDMVNGWPLKLHYTSKYFDAMDPQRQSQGQAYMVGAYETVFTDSLITGATSPNPNQSAGVPLYELWPHPVSGQTFYVRMKAKGARFTLGTQELPTSVVEEAMVLDWALGRYAYPFALANRAHFPQFKDTDLPSLIRTKVATVEGQITSAYRQDQEQNQTDVYNRGHGLRAGAGAFGRHADPGYPVDANFLQSHLVRF